MTSPMGEVYVVQGLRTNEHPVECWLIFSSTAGTAETMQGAVEQVESHFQLNHARHHPNSTPTCRVYRNAKDGSALVEVAEGPEVNARVFALYKILPMQWGGDAPGAPFPGRN